jgi:hypothetical protein
MAADTRRRALEFHAWSSFKGFRQTWWKCESYHPFVKGVLYKSVYGLEWLHVDQGSKYTRQVLSYRASREEDFGPAFLSLLFSSNISWHVMFERFWSPIALRVPGALFRVARVTNLTEVSHSNTMQVLFTVQPHVMDWERTMLHCHNHRGIAGICIVRRTIKNRLAFPKVLCILSRACSRGCSID